MEERAVVIESCIYVDKIILNAPIIITDMCSECYEHCEPAEEDDDEVSSLQ